MNANRKRHVLITGGAGFIGSSLVDRLLARGERVTVLDNFNDFYQPQVKRKNIAAHADNRLFELVEGDIRSAEDLKSLMATRTFDVVVHLAAMAGVRPSLKDPSLYMDVNVLGTQRLIDAMLKQDTMPHLVFGSSSSVYGERAAEKFQETDRIDRPVSPYAASKAAGEALCFAAHHSTGMSIICLRFFTVYGPRQRPDLAIHKFCRLIDEGEPIEVYGDGTSQRDYTYVADIVSGVEAAMALTSPAFEIINLGRSEPATLGKMITALEEALGKQAKIVHRPPQVGDVPNTFADIEKARRLLGYKPETSIKDGINNFVNWYKQEKAVLQLR